MEVMVGEVVLCRFCRESVHPAATKCPHCHEYLATEEQRPRGADRRIASGILTLVGKLFVPLTIVALALVYRPTLEGLLRRATQAEFLGTKIVFGDTKAFSGSLTPYELYLIGSAKNFDKQRGSAWNFDILKSNGRDRVFTDLKPKDCSTFESRPTQARMWATSAHKRLLRGQQRKGRIS